MASEFNLDGDKKAQELFERAEKTLKKWFTFSNKYEDAQELFTSAGNKWKATKNWQSAGHAFMRASDMHTKLDSKHEAASSLVEGAQCYKKASNWDQAILCFKMANELHIDMGRFTNAAKYEMELGEIYKNDSKIEEAIAHYKKAADYYQGEDQTSMVNKCNTIVADICAQEMRYPEAIELYEQIAKGCLSKQLLSFHTKDFLFKAMVCLLAQITSKPGGEGIEKAHDTMERYTAMDPHFGNGRDYELLQKVIEAVEHTDEDMMGHACSEYSSVCTLDDWKTTLLYRIRRKLSPEEIEANMDLC